MANSAQSKKRARQAEIHRAHNASMRSTLRTAVKKVVNALASQDKAVAENTYKDAAPLLDKMARKGIIHKNKAARHKSRLSAHIKSL